MVCFCHNKCVIFNFLCVWGWKQKMCKYSITIYTKEALLSREAELHRAEPFWLLFSSETQKKVCLWCIWYTLRLCSCQPHGLMGTKWQHSWLCYHDFQIIWVNFWLLINRMRNQVKNCCVSFFFFFFCFLSIFISGAHAAFSSSALILINWYSSQFEVCASSWSL